MSLTALGTTCYLMESTGKAIFIGPNMLRKAMNGDG